MSDRSILGFTALLASAGEDEIAKTGRALDDQLEWSDGCRYDSLIMVQHLRKRIAYALDQMKSAD